MNINKHHIFILGLLLCGTGLTACHHDDIPDGTSYTIKSKIPSIVTKVITATFIEYDAADNRVDSNKIAKPTFNKEYTFVACGSAHHIKVRLDSDEGTHRWGDTILCLVPDKNTKVVIDQSYLTRYSLHEPMLND
jgi:hypothetical protein